jgi:hypothetical protein
MRVEQTLLFARFCIFSRGGAGIYACVAAFQDNRLQPLRKCPSTIIIEKKTYLLYLPVKESQRIFSVSNPI